MTVVPEPAPENGEGSNLNGVKAALAVGGGKDAVAFGGEEVGQGGAHGQFVFDD